METNQQLRIFGEVLFDHFPDGSRVLGGAPFNVAWHLQAFGAEPLFVSCIGDDAEGREIAGLMAGWGMCCDGLQSAAGYATGSVRVQIENGEPHYDIVADSAYDFISTEKLPVQSGIGILYHGSLAIRNAASRAALQAIKDRHRGKIFIDVNLRPPWWQPATLITLLDDADWVKLNADELRMLCPDHDNTEDAMRAFCTQFGPDTLVVTRGAEGAIACDAQGRIVAIEPEPNLAIVDTVGAGDAFAAVLLLGLSQTWPLPASLRRAQEFAGAIVGRRGATVSDKDFYRRYREKWGLRTR